MTDSTRHPTNKLIISILSPQVSQENAESVLSYTKKLLCVYGEIVALNFIDEIPSSPIDCQVCRMEVIYYHLLGAATAKLKLHRQQLPDSYFLELHFVYSEPVDVRRKQTTLLEVPPNVRGFVMSPPPSPPPEWLPSNDERPYKEMLPVHTLTLQHDDVESSYQIMMEHEERLRRRLMSRHRDQPSSSTCATSHPDDNHNSSDTLSLYPLAIPQIIIQDFT